MYVKSVFHFGKHALLFMGFIRLFILRALTRSVSSRIFASPIFAFKLRIIWYQFALTLVFMAQWLTPGCRNGVWVIQLTWLFLLLRSFRLLFIRLLLILSNVSPLSVGFVQIF